MGSKQRIIVIDGEPVVRRVVTAILERAGYSIEATGDFAYALDQCKTTPPDLVLTNVLLPGITGHNAMLALKKSCPRIPVLMVSGLPSEPAIAEWRQHDGFDVFPKPFMPATLIAKVEEMLNSKSSASGSAGGDHPVEE